MDFDPKTPPNRTSDTTSFAYKSARDRWPVILTGAIDDVHKATSKAADPAAQEEGKRIVEEIAKLKYELQHDRRLTPLPDDGSPDIAGYNEELQRLGTPTWFNVPWLYSECYMYRRMNTFFSLSTKWKNYDVFHSQKMSTFKSSRAAVVELASRYHNLISQLRDPNHATRQSKSPEELLAAEQILFTEMCEICLWGNATDLSLLTNLSYEDIQKLQGSSARKAAEKNILVNDLPAAFKALKDAQERSKSSSSSDGNSDRRVDIALDNAGFELFVDLILAGYLLSSDLATNVVLHPKTIPWFVSDVIPADFSALLNALADPQSFYTSPPLSSSSSLSKNNNGAKSPPQPLSATELADLSFLFHDLSDLHADGKLILRPNRFWTEAGSYWRLPGTQPALHDDLKSSELVIFKGDLHYRKLTADAMWPPTTPFAEAIGPLGADASGVRVLALRTCKADVVVGLPEGRDEELRRMEGGVAESGAREWAWSGKWAVVQFCDGKA